MREAMIPRRTPICAVRPAPTDRHEPDPRTVQGEFNTALQWYFGVCAYCDESISLYRVLASGRWFDAWGAFDEAAFLADGSGSDGWLPPSARFT